MPHFPFTLPPPSNCEYVPEWTDRGFRLGDKIHPVLKYTVGESGWTDDLTGFHEDVAGENHYIDIASREHALSRLSKWVAGAHPVIMDIGCSSGFFLKCLRERLPHAVVVGSDYVPGPLEQLAQRLDGIPLIQFDLLKCPLPADSLDAAVLLNVLEHIEDDELAVKQVFRILKPGGVAVIEVPAGPDLYDVYDKHLMHHRRYNMRGLLRVLNAAGFEVMEKSHLGFFVYPGFWLIKKRNRRKLGASAEAQRAIVAANIRSHAGSALMNTVMRMEAAIRRFAYYPVGIRCLAVARKPLG